MREHRLLLVGEFWVNNPELLLKFSDAAPHVLNLPSAASLVPFFAIPKKDQQKEMLAVAGDGDFLSLWRQAKTLRDTHHVPVLVCHPTPDAGLLPEDGLAALAFEFTRTELDAVLGVLLSIEAPIMRTVASQEVASFSSFDSDAGISVPGSGLASTRRVYTIDQLARLLDMPIEKVRGHLEAGELHAQPNPLGGTWTLTPDELRQFMERHDLDTRFSEEPLRVLIVDDEQAIVGLISNAIQFAGYNIITDSAGNGYDAMLKIGSTRPDLVILDVQMPGADGKKVLQAIRSNMHTSTTRILAVSAHPDAIQEMTNRGADDALIKPFDLKTLLGKLETLLPSIAKRRTP